MWIQRKQQLLQEEEGQLSQPQVVVTAETEKTTNPLTKTEEEVDPFTELDPHIADRDYAGFAIGIIKRTVKQEDSLVRQIFYTGLSKDSTSPINLAVLAPTSEGKTHAVVESMNYFPTEDVWMIGSMTPKVIIRQNGVLVDTNNQPLQGKIKELKKQISSCKDNNLKEDLQERLHWLYQESKILIDLRGKLFVFLEPPHPDTWAILKPILSHDKYETEHPYVYKVETMGFSVKKVVTRGWPACIFCSAKNESKWPEWPEIASRFLITSPNMVPQKYLEGNILIAQQTGLPKSLQQHLIVSDNDAGLAKKCVVYLIQQMKRFTENTINNNTNSVWFPFSQILAEILPSDKGTDNRFTKRLFSFLKIITLARAHLRSRLEYGSESLVITDLQNDFSEVLCITQNLSSMPPFKLKFFKEFFIPAFNLKQTPDTDCDGKQENTIAVTTRQVCDYYKAKTGKAMSTNNLKQNYLNEFINNGLIDDQDSLLDKRQKIYYPLIDLFADNEREHRSPSTDSPEKIKELSIENAMDNILQQPKLLMPRNCMNIPENWLNLEILGLLKYPLNAGKFELYNERNERICICKFIKEYEKTHKFTGYFSKPIFRNYSSKVFGSMSYFRRFNNEQYKKLSIESKMDNFFISDRGAKTTSVSPAANNTLYSQTGHLKNIQNQGYSSNSSTAIFHNNITFGHKYERQEEEEKPLQQKFQDEALPKNKLDTFLQAFEELENEAKVTFLVADEEIDKNEDAVDGGKLKQLLVAKGAFSNVGEAHSFIQQMVLSKQLEEVGFETYKRTQDKTA